ncbi:4'-phosphopantetheinyl transferase family protein [Streptomyces hesseae]|uniref:4-phosphopantetheinyl transferase n=1 Tax=Streptomyces hesseae TaxID=3075519 RepID=A0ABU2SQ71_9ACTN|nr:4-phosphopantetheinyl transferase [Streptomyces sp. DSM 40473]MDT0451151.1 4-phosphopantetheinyl transferase [Streptomyces sp. DSM 40473]
MQLPLDPATALRPGHAADASWPTALDAPPAGALDLWLLRLPGPWLGATALDEAPLDGQERARADAFAHPFDRAGYVAAHLTLRRILGAYLDAAPGAVDLVREACPCCGGPHGRPAAPGAPFFSLARGEGLVLIGVASAPVGVAAERPPGIHTVAEAARSLHPAEHREVMAAPVVRRPAVHSRLRVRKRAYLKGLGAGLGRSPALDYVGNGGPDTPPWPAGWTIVDVPAGTASAAAAVRGRLTVRYDVRRLDPEDLAA